VWLAPLHVRVLPPPQIPVAPLAPHPPQFWPITRTNGSVQSSEPPQLPATVEHPVPSLQSETQHSLPPPSVHAVELAVQVHVLQLPAPSQLLVHVAG
jgi:hypothetical protein